MALYELGVVGADPAAGGGAIIAIRTSAAAQARIFEIWASCTGGTGAGITAELARTTAVGTASTSSLGQATDPADAASNTNIDTAWSVAPTISTSKFRGAPGQGGAVAGVAPFKWEWARDAPLIVPVSASVVISSPNNWPQWAVVVLWEE